MARIIAAFTQFFDRSGDPLVNGKIQFLESGTNNTDKTTYKDSALTHGLENTNPVLLDGDGRCPNVFGSGVYNVILFTADDVQIQQFDPVGATASGSQFDEWAATETYDKGDIVRATDGEYYQSFINNNNNNNPVSSPAEWDKITILKRYVENATGDVDAITADFVPVLHALTDKVRVLVRSIGPNTITNPTFSPNGLPAKEIVKNGNVALFPGDLVGVLDLIYNESNDNWEIINPATTNPLTGPVWDGEVYVDPDAVGANPTAKIYPDGTVVGSTDNGSYTKYPNGDLECSIKGLFVQVNTTSTWVFPVQFSSVESVTPTGYHTATSISEIAMDGTGSIVSPSLTQAVIRNRSTSTGNLMFVIAKGRWV